MMTVRNKVQLITYPDSLGGNLGNLGLVLDQFFPGLFEGGIHILPPFPSSSDRGFAPLTYLEIDPRLGSWEDIKRISEKSPVMLDLIVNHLSSSSPYFQDYLHKGRNSAYADLFIPTEKFWPNEAPAPEDIEKIFLRRPEPFSQYRIQATGDLKKLWTTFGKDNPSEQVDIDINSAVAQDMIMECMSNFSRNGVKMVRLDAVGYVIKKIGTSCFFVEPEMFQFLEWIKGLADSLGIDLLPEVHAEYPIQQKLVNQGYWTYDFILPYLMLEALTVKNSLQLKEYLANRPEKQFTMLDCHDGIPVKPDLDGIFLLERARKVVELCLQRGGNINKILSFHHRETDGFNVHQINGTYYSLLGGNEDAYLAARVLQLFVPGIPQVYYVGLLAGKNDETELLRTGDGRDINRHNYSIHEIEHEIQRPIVQKLIKLIQFRNSSPAFDGSFRMDQCADHELSMSWANQDDHASLYIDLRTNSIEIKYKDGMSGKERMLNGL